MLREERIAEFAIRNTEPRCAAVTRQEDQEKVGSLLGGRIEQTAHRRTRGPVPDRQVEILRLHRPEGSSQERTEVPRVVLRVAKRWQAG